MNEITTVGLDLAKHVFQVHGVDASGAPGLCASGCGGARCLLSSPGGLPGFVGSFGGVRDGTLLGAGEVTGRSATRCA